MTAEFESTAVLLLILLTIACLVQVIFGGLLLWYMKRVADSLVSMRGPASPPPPPQSTSQAPMIPAPSAVAVEAPKVVEAEKAGPAEDTRPEAPTVDILKESPDIQVSIHRFCEKYNLSDFIITTLDGLVVISLYPGSSEEAARSSDLYRRKKKPDSPNVTFFEIPHRGEAMLGIIRSDHPISPEEWKKIDEDAQRILDWWL
jgi:hypothetical protein